MWTFLYVYAFYIVCLSRGLRLTSRLGSYCPLGNRDHACVSNLENIFCVFAGISSRS